MRVRRVRLRFAGGVEVLFADRSVGLGWLLGVAERGTPYPVVVYGPEGCGKTAFLRQAMAVLEDAGYEVVYFNPLGEAREVLRYTPSIEGLVREVLRGLPQPYQALADAVLTLAGELLRRLRRPRLALLVDDVFQAVGLGRAEAYVKSLLNLIEYPPGDYDRIVVIVASSEGVTRARIGRHRWATMLMMWNMGRGGFRELYEQLPAPKPPFEEAWNATGGNPDALRRLYTTRWSPGSAAREMARVKGLRTLLDSLPAREKTLLAEALEDPDTLAAPEAESLRRRLIELNLVAELWERDPEAWLDTPPPEKDQALGIGSRVAWQTPLHREAARIALES